jgi:c-di-AMP phosphodiesterase-like protein
MASSNDKTGGACCCLTFLIIIIAVIIQSIWGSLVKLPSILWIIVLLIIGLVVYWLYLQSKINKQKKMNAYFTGEHLKSESDKNNDGETYGIVLGIIVLLVIGSAEINNLGSIANYFSNLLYGTVFLILLIGILYEGAKAIT